MLRTEERDRDSRRRPTKYYAASRVTDKGQTMRVLLTDGSDDVRTAGSWPAQFPLPAGGHPRVVCAVSIPPSPLAVPPVRDFVASLRVVKTGEPRGADRL
jgi:hypothetical protein